VNRRTRYGFLMVICVSAMCGVAFAELNRLPSGPMAIGCDQQGMAYTTGKQSVPWMMTPSGPVRGDAPGSSLGYQMTCDEAQSAFGFR
jgi:hypothetical protein